MSRLIDADELEELFREVIGAISKEQSITKDMEHMVRASAMTIEMINDAPTVDAVPVVHGAWVETPYDYNKPTPSARFSCSKCGRRTGYRQSKTFNYCPNCGAKMDGGRRREND